MKQYIKLLCTSMAIMLIGCSCSIVGNDNSGGIQQSTEMSMEVSSDSDSVQRSSLSQNEIRKALGIDTGKLYKFEKKYYVNKLDNDMLSMFCRMYQAAVNFETEVNFSRSINSETLDNLMFLLNYDCPELIHLMGEYQPMYVDESFRTVSGVRFTFSMSKDEYEANTKELRDYSSKLRSDMYGKKESEIERYLYDTIFEKCMYAENELYAGSVYGTLILGKGRCEGICKSVEWCMRELGLNCICVTGTPNWNAGSLYSAHSWNIIEVDGQYYHLDLTVDNMTQYGPNIKYPPCYGFYNVDESTILKTRTLNTLFTDLGIPECNSMKENYHVVNSLVISGNDEDTTENGNELAENPETEAEGSSYKNSNGKKYSGIEGFELILREKFSTLSDNTENSEAKKEKCISFLFDSDDVYSEAENNIDDIMNKLLKDLSIEELRYWSYGNGLSRTITVKIGEDTNDDIETYDPVDDPDEDNPVVVTE